MNTLERQQLLLCAEKIRDARRLLFITGAGISAESGLPTYRGVSGLYDDARTDEGVSIEEALSAAMFESNPRLTWKYLLQIARACDGKRPNAAHHALVELEKDRDVHIITQNIDGFHIDAGSSRVVEMHGNMKRLLCTECQMSAEVSSYTQINDLPHCEHCNGLQRPKVVLFGEMLPEEALDAYYRIMVQRFDMIFSVGTTSVFPYISGPVERGIQEGTFTVEINPANTHLSNRVDLHVQAKAGEWLQGLLNAL